MATKISQTMLEAVEGYERRELEEWLEFNRLYPTLEDKLKAQIRATFPGIRFADETEHEH